MKRDISMPAGFNVLRAAKKIVHMPTGKAERAIEAIADKDGDEVAKIILGHLPPVKIAEILRQHDFSCPSIISWMLTPQLAVNLLRIDPLFWMHVYNGKDFENFVKIQSDALDLMLSILSNAKSKDQQRSILHQVRSDGLSRQYLLLPFVGWEIKEDQRSEFEDPEIDFGTPDHLYEMIR